MNDQMYGVKVILDRRVPGGLAHFKVVQPIGLVFISGVTSTADVDSYIQLHNGSDEPWEGIARLVRRGQVLTFPFKEVRVWGEIEPVREVQMPLRSGGFVFKPMAECSFSIGGESNAQQPRPPVTVTSSGPTPPQRQPQPGTSRPLMSSTASLQTMNIVPPRILMSSTVKAKFPTATPNPRPVVIPMSSTVKQVPTATLQSVKILSFSIGEESNSQPARPPVAVTSYGARPPQPGISRPRLMPSTAKEIQTASLQSRNTIPGRILISSTAKEIPTPSLQTMNAIPPRESMSSTVKAKFPTATPTPAPRPVLKPMSSTVKQIPTSLQPVKILPRPPRLSEAVVLKRIKIEQICEDDDIFNNSPSSFAQHQHQHQLSPDITLGPKITIKQEKMSPVKTPTMPTIPPPFSGPKVTIKQERLSPVPSPIPPSLSRPKITIKQERLSPVPSPIPPSFSRPKITIKQEKMSPRPPLTMSIPMPTIPPPFHGEPMSYQMDSYEMKAHMQILEDIFKEDEEQWEREQAELMDLSLVF